MVDANIGGYIGHGIKYAGYDAIILDGKSDKPVYFKIDDDKVTVEDTSRIWGKGTYHLVKEWNVWCLTAKKGNS